MDNIIVLGHFFNLTKKYILIGRLKYDLTQIFHNFVVAYFLGHPVYINIIKAVAYLGFQKRDNPLPLSSLRSRPSYRFWESA